MTTTNATPWLAIATDSFLSGWGGAAGRASLIVYECRDEHDELARAFEVECEIQRNARTLPRSCPETMPSTYLDA